MMRYKTAGQMIQVLVKFREKYRRSYNVDSAHIAAIEEVAAQQQLRPQTIRDLCFRRLDLSSVNNFRDPLEKWMLGNPESLRRLLKRFMPRSTHADLDGVLTEEANAAVVEQKAPPGVERTVRRLDENFTVSLDPDSGKKVKVLALMKGISSGEWLREFLVKVVDREYAAWLNSEKAK